MLGNHGLLARCVLLPNLGNKSIVLLLNGLNSRLEFLHSLGLLIHELLLFCCKSGLQVNYLLLELLDSPLQLHLKELFIAVGIVAQLGQHLLVLLLLGLVLTLGLLSQIRFHLVVVFLGLGLVLIEVHTEVKELFLELLHRFVTR